MLQNQLQRKSPYRNTVGLTQKFTSPLVTESLAPAPRGKRLPAGRGPGSGKTFALDLATAGKRLPAGPGPGGEKTSALNRAPPLVCRLGRDPAVGKHPRCPTHLPESVCHAGAATAAHQGSRPTRGRGKASTIDGDLGAVREFQRARRLGGAPRALLRIASGITAGWIAAAEPPSCRCASGVPIGGMPIAVVAGGPASGCNDSR